MMQAGGATLLKDFWYLALADSKRVLKPGGMTAAKVMGEPLVFCRRGDGEIFVLRDICPHRGIPLSYGRFDGNQVHCSYHGWRFDGAGNCTLIPSLVEEQKLDLSRICTKAYPAREIQGNIWVNFGETEAAGGSAEGPGIPEPPLLPDVGEGGPRVLVSQAFPCSMDHAAFGLMDPTHAAFVHTSWWWKKGAATLRSKEKHFEPAPYGWRMKRHALPTENRVYKLLGEGVTTEISYSLPGLRIEHVRGSKHAVVNLTAITPVTETQTVVHNMLYWTMDWLTPFSPIIRKLADIFLTQDRVVVVRQQEGLAYDPALILVDDADKQAKWFNRVKKEWMRAREQGRAFENPVKEETLRWRS